MPTSVPIARPDLDHSQKESHHQRPSAQSHPSQRRMSKLFEKLDEGLEHTMHKSQSVAQDHHQEHHVDVSSKSMPASVHTHPPEKPALHRSSTGPARAQSGARSRPSSWSGETLSEGEPVVRHVRSLHPNAHHLRHRPEISETRHVHGPRHPPVPLMPSRNPPPFDWVDVRLCLPIFALYMSGNEYSFERKDVFPFLAPLRSLYRALKRKTETTAKRERRLRKRHRTLHDDNLPLAIQLYFSSYVSLLQRRRILDVPTTSALMRSVKEFEENLTKLEKIVTTCVFPFVANQ